MTLRGHEWPLFHVCCACASEGADPSGAGLHEDLNKRFFGNEIVEERLFKSRVLPRKKGSGPLGLESG
jgi:hypothetical protein